MARRNPDQVASLAAMLLFGRFDAEPHMVKAAIAAANLILDEVTAAADEEAEASTKPAKAPAAK